MTSGNFRGEKNLNYAIVCILLLPLDNDLALADIISWYLSKAILLLVLDTEDKILENKIKEILRSQAHCQNPISTDTLIPRLLYNMNFMAMLFFDTNV